MKIYNLNIKIRMNENPPNKKERNAHKKKTDQPIIMQYENKFSNESEIIAKYILEKIISLSIFIFIFK